MMFGNAHLSGALSIFKVHCPLSMRKDTALQKFIEIQYLLEQYKGASCFTYGPSCVMIVTARKVPLY
jgi:hypothetical protein